jgi:hypothetical protein
MSEATPAAPAAPASPAAPAAPTPAAPAAPAPAAAVDYGAVWGTLSPDNAETFSRKGWDKAGSNGGPVDVNAVFDAYRGLEKLVGTDKIPAPRLDDEGALDQWEGWKKLGVPEKPDEYKIQRAEMPKGPDGQALPYDENLERVFLTAAHKAKIPQAKVQSLYNELINARIGEISGMIQAMSAEVTETEQKLAREFGASVAAHKTRAKEAATYAAQKIGVDANVLVDKVAHAMGSYEAIKLFNWIGESLAEDTLKGGGNSGFQDSPAAAKAEQQRLMQDPNFMTVYRDRRHPGHRDAVDRMARLQRLVSGS